MAEFGESVLYIPLRGDEADRRKAKIDLEPRFLNGIYLGLLDRSDEIVVWGPEGVRKARTIRRRPDGERWRPDEVFAIRGTPLMPNPGSEESRIRTKNDTRFSSPEQHGGASHQGGYRQGGGGAEAV